MKPITNNPGYFITSDGRVWSEKRGGRFLKPGRCGQYGYLVVVLYSHKKRKTYYVHRLVLEAFVGPCPKGMECRHLNGNLANNHLDNLIWGTPKENHADMAIHGKIPYGEQHKSAKLTEQQVRQIIYMYRTKLFTQQELGDTFNIDRITVNKIINRKIWKHIWRHV